MPLDGVADSMRGKVLKLAPPAEVANEILSARITLYGRFLAQ
jgi:hypothetical protein